MSKNQMEENLFVSHPILSKTLLQVKAMSVVFLDVSLVDTNVTEKLPLFLFVEMQV